MAPNGTSTQKYPVPHQREIRQKGLANEGLDRRLQVGIRDIKGLMTPAETSLDVLMTLMRTSSPPHEDIINCLSLWTVRKESFKSSDYLMTLEKQILKSVIIIERSRQWLNGWGKLCIRRIRPPAVLILRMSIRAGRNGYSSRSNRTMSRPNEAKFKALGHRSKK